MDPTTFDRIRKAFSARRLSRRETIRAGGVGAAAALAAGLGARAATAQDATPVAGTPVAGGEGKTVEFLFVQSFEGGTLASKEGADGTYTVTLDHGLGQTLFFSDRPDRIVGAAPTDRVLAELGFLPENPPNAALVTSDGAGGTDIAVVELTNAVYDAAVPSVTYDLTTLEAWETSLEMGFTEAPAGLAALPATLGATHLFIDDCPDWPTYCVTTNPNRITGFFLGNEGHCWCLSPEFSCLMCRDKPTYQALCAQARPDLCTDQYPCDQTYSVGGTPLADSDYWSSGTHTCSG